APPAENRSVIIPIRYQITMKPIMPASTVTRTSLLTMLVDPHRRDGKLVEIALGLDAGLQGAIVADKPGCFGHDLPIKHKLVQIVHQHRGHDELECKRGERRA